MVESEFDGFRFFFSSLPCPFDRLRADGQLMQYALALEKLLFRPRFASHSLPPCKHKCINQISHRVQYKSTYVEDFSIKFSNARFSSTTRTVGRKDKGKREKITKSTSVTLNFTTPSHPPCLVETRTKGASKHT